MWIDAGLMMYMSSEAPIHCVKDSAEMRAWCPDWLAILTL